MPKRPITPEDLLNLIFVGDAQISPTGKDILFARRTIINNQMIGQLNVVSPDQAPRALTTGETGASQGRFSPDGSQVAFIATRPKPKAQIFVLPLGGGEARAITDLPEGSLGEFRWSPDGRTIAYTFRPTSEDRTAAASKAREEAKGSTPPWAVDNAWYRLDGDGMFGGARHAIYLVDVATGATRKLYEAGPLGLYSFDWSPNSQELVVSHSIQKNPWAEAPNDQLFRVTLDGQAWMLEGLPKGDKGTVRWSPDGASLAYLGDISETDPWGVRNTKLYVVSAQGGEVTCLTEANDVCLAGATLSDTRDGTGDGNLQWTPDSAALIVSVPVHGAVQIGRVPREGGGLQVLTEGQHALAIGSLSADGRNLAATYATATRPAEIALVDLSASPVSWSNLTNFNQPFLDEVQVAAPEEVWIESTGDQPVHAWIMFPPKHVAPKRLPAVLEIHGGPHTQYGWTFFHEFQVLAAQGYIVVYSNPRGSKGYGEAWCAAIRGDWGHHDWEDVEAVTRWMQQHPSISPGQMGVMGGSYGGYMTNWVVGHTDAYRAAITDRCVSNLVSMAGSSDFPMNKDEYFGGYAYGDLAAITELWRQSPLAYFDRVKTPMLIIHSEGDLRCNIEQGEQVFVALQVQGIESRFVRYPASTSHGLSRNGPPDLRLHRLGEITRWWGRQLKIAE